MGTMPFPVKLVIQYHINPEVKIKKGNLMISMRLVTKVGLKPVFDSVIKIHKTSATLIIPLIWLSRHHLLLNGF